MKENLLTGYWKGYYKYGNQYAATLQEIENNFDMELVVFENKITGKCKDEDIRNLFEESADIFGYISNENSLNFTKQYPFLHSIDDDGNLIIDKSMRHPPIDYSGVFDAGTNTVSGNWRMEIIQVISNDTVVKHEFDGTWFMKKI